MCLNDSVLLDYPFWSQVPNRDEPPCCISSRPKDSGFEIANDAGILVLGTLCAGNLGEIKVGFRS